MHIQIQDTKFYMHRYICQENVTFLTCLLIVITNVLKKTYISHHIKINVTMFLINKQTGRTS